MNRILFIVFVLAAALSGCALNQSAAQRIAQLHVGMTLEEVTALLGKPHTTTNQGALVIYDYAFTQAQAPASSYYVIVGRDGRVRSYGPN